MDKLAKLCLIVLVFGIISHFCIAATIHEDDRPTEHLCPITLSVMVNPVLAADGHSYEHDAILTHFRVNGAKSPKTNLPLAHTNLTPNHALRALINDWKPEKQSEEGVRRPLVADTTIVDAPSRSVSVYISEFIRKISRVWQKEPTQIHSSKTGLFLSVFHFYIPPTQTMHFSSTYPVLSAGIEVYFCDLNNSKK